MHSKIDFATFVNSLDGLLDEVQKIRNKAIFRILDIRKKGQIEILVLMQLINGLDLNTHFAQEILLLVREYKEKNVLMSAGYSRQITMNFAKFNDLVPNSCLVDEL